MKVSIFCSALVASIASLVSAQTLEGTESITPQDYIGLPAHALANNPPACGMPYRELNLARITAVKNMKTGSTCNLCLKVVNNANPSKFVYVLAVDLGGRGLDLSIPSFEYLFDQRYDASPATWSTVDYSHCAGIYTPGKINPNQGVQPGSPSDSTPITTKPKTTTKAVTKTRTTYIKKKTTTRKAVSKKTTTKKLTHKTTSKKKAVSKKISKNGANKKKTTKKAINKKKTSKKASKKASKKGPKKGPKKGSKKTTKHPWWKKISSKKSKKHSNRPRRAHGQHKRRLD